MEQKLLTYFYKSSQLIDTVYETTNSITIIDDRQLTTTIPSSITTKSISMTNKQESYEEIMDSRFPRWFAVVLLVVGLFGNTICLVIFSQKQMRKNSTFIYLAFLSIVDLFVLSLGLGDIVLISYFNFVIRDKSIITCRLHSFLTYVFTHLSSFILASVSIDRAIATNLINFSKVYCKPKTAYRIIFLNISLAVFINFHSLLFMGHLSDSGELTNRSSSNNGSTDYVNLINDQTKNRTSILDNSFSCASKKGTLYDNFIEPYFKWIDLFSYAILPFFTMAVCTILIVRVLFLSNRRLNKNHNKLNKKNKAPLPTVPSSNVTGNGGGGNGGSGATVTTNLIKSNNNAQTNIISKKSNSRANKAKHLTYTLVTLNGLFFCLVSPLVIVLIVLAGKETDGDNRLLINAVYLLAYSNHSFNFILYGISSPPYRESLLKMLRSNNQTKTRQPALNHNV